MQYVRPFSQRIVAGTTGTLSWQQIDGTGEPADPGTVTVTVTRADGTALVTAQATSGTGSDARTYGLSVSQTATLDRLTVTWVASGVTLATTEVDVVAAPWFSNVELRANEPALKNESTYPASTIAAARLYVESMIERITHRRWVPGYDLRWLHGNTSTELVLPFVDVRRVRSAALYDDPSAAAVETLGSTELAAIPFSPSGVICRYNGKWAANWVKVGAEHGAIAPPPDLNRAAMRLTRETLVGTKVGNPDQAVTWNSTDLGWTASFVTPGVRGQHTSIPWVNEILDAWTLNDVGIG